MLCRSRRPDIPDYERDDISQRHSIRDIAEGAASAPAVVKESALKVKKEKWTCN